MSARSFGSLFMVASCASAALGCYLVSLRVASERAALESVESQIVSEQRDMRLLQTEIGTRGRLAQLERWNVKVLALSAPSADQFLHNGFELARLTQPEHKVDFAAPVVLASAPTPARPPIGSAATDDTAVPPSPTPSTLLHEASLKTEERSAPSVTVTTASPASGARKAVANSTTGKKSAAMKIDNLQAMAASKHPPVKAEGKTLLAATGPTRASQHIAKVDPFAALPRKPATALRKD